MSCDPKRDPYEGFRVTVLPPVLPDPNRLQTTRYRMGDVGKFGEGQPDWCYSDSDPKGPPKGRRKRKGRRS